MTTRPQEPAVPQFFTALGHSAQRHSQDHAATQLILDPIRPSGETCQGARSGVAPVGAALL